MKKVPRLFDEQKFDVQVKNIFTGVPNTNPGACFNRSTWSPATHMQQFGESTPEPEDVLDPQGEGVWRCHDSPAELNGGADEPRKNPQFNDRSSNKQCVPRFGRGRGTVGIDDGGLNFYSLAEVQMRGTDRLHCTDEHENTDSSREEAL